jgi:sulfatase maturation enzyme AslB (radical SAM superfamily)
MATLDYFEEAKKTKDKLNQISSTMCMAKWLQVSMHLTSGLTQSCYHPPTHKIPLDELEENPKALHNTIEKVKQRRDMWQGKRPTGCQYCWNIEDAPDGPHLSDRHYRSSEVWAQDGWNEVIDGGWDNNINPRYVEVNFNQACNFKCTYCSPHLSTTWQKEIEDYGPYDLGDDFKHNDIKSLSAAELMPINSSNKDNPYVEAFWDWWPDLYKDLKVFRMTGGEPLMDKNTFRVLDYVNKNPNSTLDLSITSNMCPPDQRLFDKFIKKLKAIEEVRIWEDKEKFNPDSGNNWYVAPACKHFSLFISLDSTGEQAEYIRTGLDYERMMKNIKTFMKETQGSEISFINTFNLLSIPRLKEFLQMILDLRIEFGYENQTDHVIQPPDRNGFVHPPFVRKRRQRVWFDIPYLRQPEWMSAQNAAFYPELISMLEDCLVFMENNVENEHYGRTYHGFKHYEIAKLKRDIAWIKNGKTELSVTEMSRRKKQFWLYFNQIDQRRNTKFPEVFPELGNWWNDCYKHFNESNKI